MNNESKVYDCGQTYQSGCIVYTGVLPNFMLDDNLDCEISLNTLLGTYGETIDSILEGLDLTELDPGCLDFDPEIITLTGLEQVQLDKICEHETEILALQTAVDDLAISESLIEIDLDCLTEEAAPCETEDNTYTLQSILETFKTAICDLRAQVNECCLSGGNSGTSGTTGNSGTSGSSGTSGGNGLNGTSGSSGTSGTSGVLS